MITKLEVIALLFIFFLSTVSAVNNFITTTVSPKSYYYWHVYSDCQYISLTSYCSPYSCNFLVFSLSNFELYKRNSSASVPTIYKSTNTPTYTYSASSEIISKVRGIVIVLENPNPYQLRLELNINEQYSYSNVIGIVSAVLAPTLCVACCCAICACAICFACCSKKKTVRNFSFAKGNNNLYYQQQQQAYSTPLEPIGSYNYNSSSYNNNNNNNNNNTYSSGSSFSVPKPASPFAYPIQKQYKQYEQQQQQPLLYRQQMDEGAASPPVYTPAYNPQANSEYNNNAPSAPPMVYSSANTFNNNL